MEVYATFTVALGEIVPLEGVSVVAACALPASIMNPGRIRRTIARILRFFIRMGLSVLDVLKTEKGTAAVALFCKVLRENSRIQLPASVTDQ